MTESTEGCTYCGSDAHSTTDCRWRGQLAVSEVIAEDNARKIQPSLVESTADLARTAAHTVGKVQAAIAQRDARIEEQAREIERLRSYESEWEHILNEQREELAALKAQLSGVALPERRIAGNDLACGYVNGWNHCVDEVERLDRK